MPEFEKAFFRWAIEMIVDFADERHTDEIVEEFCDYYGFNEDVQIWLQRKFFEQGALEAGIPISVVKGEKTLREVLPQSYIDDMKSGNLKY